MPHRLRTHPTAALACAALLLSTPLTGAAQTEPDVAEASLEALVERVTRAVVLIDVRTASDSRQGSGFLIDPAGLILTNQHVVRNAQGARVKLSNGDMYDNVTILAEDARRDIAVLQIPGFGLPTLPMGNSDSVRIGSQVILVGSPLGLENTVSTGIVSGRRQEPEGFQLLQITAPASRGSSGGAVLSANGEVVGVAASQLLAGQNLNFAVPINYARGLLQQVDRATPVVLAPMSDQRVDTAPQPMANSDAVNGALTFDLDGIGGYVVETEMTMGEHEFRKARVTYRVIETVGGSSRRIERYSESETTRSTEPFGTLQTVRRERVRALMEIDRLRPISSAGEISWWTDQGWVKAEHDVRFEGNRVMGVVTDTTGRGLDLDRTVPEGILLRNVTDLAFATLAIDSLVGRSVEFATLDPWTGEVADDRYDILGTDTTELAGPRRPVLRVNVATGLSNQTILFELTRPRIALRRVTEDGARLEEITRMEIFRNPGDASTFEFSDLGRHGDCIMLLDEGSPVGCRPKDLAFTDQEIMRWNPLHEPLSRRSPWQPLRSHLVM
jgi:S1-C subfamily serine protease